MHSRLELGRKKVSMSLVVAALASAWATAVLAQTTVTWDGSTNMTWTQPDSTSWRGATYESSNTAVFAGTGTGTISGTVTPGQINVTAGSYTLSGAIGGGGGIAMGGSGTLTLSGSTANTYSGTTTVSAGRLELGKTANGTAVAGDLVITGAAVTFGGNNQIASTAAVTMSGTGAGFNGTGFNLNHNTQLDQTLASLTVTGGVVNTNSKSTSGATGASTGLTVNGAVSVTGGAGNTDFWFGSGGLGSFGSLALVGMTGTANPSSRANNTFRLFGNSDSRQTLVTIGSGGLSLDGKPPAFGCVSFQSESGQPATSIIGPDGSFTITVFGEGPGEVPGPNRILVTCYEGQRQAAADHDQEPGLGRLLIPDRHTAYETSGLVIDVPVVLNLTR